jgi:ferredoxin-NADP reductase
MVGILFAPQIHVGDLYTTPELAILIGNLFAYVVSPKTALMLRLERRIQLAPDIYDFVFAPRRRLAFAPGQYMEWTLGHRDPDSRGNRRYFTLASSPTEETIRLGVKFSGSSSSFKEAMLSMDESTEIVASHLAGDFVLPKDPEQKLVFIAGGIGITPFRSMLKYLLDKHERRPIVVFYSAKTADEIVYRDVLDRAERELGIKVIYLITEARGLVPQRGGRPGHITPQMIVNEVPDYRHSLFYISGSKGMVDSSKELLGGLCIKQDRIKTDFFPGLT